MHFGRVPSHQLAQIDLRLPDDPDFTTGVLDRLPTSGKTPKLWFGCPVWGHKGYVGRLYPPGTKTADYLKAYGKQFNTIELNSTHYNVPPVAQFEKWASAVPDGFRFCPKFPQRISHRSRIDEPLPLTDIFLESIYALGDRLGTCFLQLPPWFNPEGIDRLHAYLASLPVDLKVAVEFRHEDWFSDPKATNDMLGMLETLGMATVITDTAGRRDVCHMGVTGPEVMIRFTGNNLHETDYPRTSDWVQRVVHWMENGVEEVVFLFHQPDEENCGEVAVHFLDEFNRLTGQAVKPPILYHRQQQALF